MPFEGEKDQRFSPAQRVMVYRAINEAEDHTARYYCFPPHRWQDLRFDVITRQDREWEPFPEPILARLQRLQKHGCRPQGSYDFFRIQLNDPGILNVARRKELGVGLYPLLVYILTHELVHLVRVSSILGENEGTGSSTEAEESRVDRISSQILSAAPDLKIDPVISRFILRHSAAAD
jgi:hypothetical protein